MNTEIQSISRNLQGTLSGEPWYGRSVYAILQEADSDKVYIRPGNNEHSIIDLLYHMLTWSEFTLNRVLGKPEPDMQAFEQRDWREIDPAQQTWQNGVAALKATHEKLIRTLESKDDQFLNETVDYREYDFRYLLNGLVQHNIYHAAQIIYVHKLLFSQ